MMLASNRTRELIEVRAAWRCRPRASRRSGRPTADVEALRGYLVETMRDSLDDLDTFMQADIRFHVQIAIGADNEVLRDLLQSLRSMLRVWVERGVRDRDQAPRRRIASTARLRGDAARDLHAAQRGDGAHMATAGERVGHADIAGPLR